jgi:hypothetical protein
MTTPTLTDQAMRKLTRILCVLFASATILIGEAEGQTSNQPGKSPGELTKEQIRRDTEVKPLGGNDPRRQEWQAQRDALKWIDLSQDTNRHVVVAEGTPEIYQAHAAVTLYNDIRIDADPRDRTDMASHGDDPLPVPYLENPPS